jgi:hypothetical protein
VYSTLLYTITCTVVDPDTIDWTLLTVGVGVVTIVSPCRFGPEAEAERVSE